MRTKELIELYKSLFETWRFEVNSHWQRSSYFAAFETVALAACWKLTFDSRPAWAGEELSILGILLTSVWLLNNNKTHAYAVYWLKQVANVEARLIQRGEPGIDFANQILNRQRTDLIAHRYLVLAVPCLFLVAWITMFYVGFSHNNQGCHMTSNLINHLFTYNSISLLVALASLLLGLAAVRISKSSLSQAEQVAVRDQRDWKQRKWYDLYFKADDAYDAVDHYKTQYPNPLLPNEDDPARIIAWNNLMLTIKTVHRIAMVFPINSAIDALVSATVTFDYTTQTISNDQLTTLFDAVQNIRDISRIDISVL